MGLDASRTAKPLRGQELFRLLQEISSSRKTGVLEFRRGDAKASIRFQEGRMLFPAGQALAAFLIREGKLPPRAARAVSEDRNPGEEPVEAMIRLGILTEEGARQGALSYLDQLLRAVAHWQDGHWDFREGSPEGGGLPTWGSCPTPGRLFSAVRSSEDTASLFPQLEDPRASVSMVTSVEGVLPELGLRPEEGYLLSRISGGTTVAEVVSLSPLGEEETRKVLCALAAAGVLQVTGGSPVPPRDPSRASPKRGRKGFPKGIPRRSPGKAGFRKRTPSPRKRPPSPPPAVPTPPPGPSTLPVDEPIELTRRVQELPHQDFYQVLGVTSSANPEEIRKNYYELVRRFHPDRYQSRGEKELAEKAETFLAHLTEAYRTLSDPSARSEYDQKRMEKERPGGQDAQVDNTRVARENDQRGLQLLHSGQLQKALQFFENAVSLDPSQDTYLCHLAQVQMRNPRLRVQAGDNLIRAIALNPSRAENYFHLGLLLEREGRFEEAARRFQEALSWEPNNEQARQHLEEIHSRKPGGGRLSRLFRK